MRSRPSRTRPLAKGLLVAVWLAAMCVAAPAQQLSPNYTLTAPTLFAEPELSPRLPQVAWGPVRLSAGRTATGSGLSLEAGENWFARAGIGRSLDSDVLSVGGGYRFSDGDALSMVVTRQFGQERLGLAVRYDWRQAYLRLGYEQPLRLPGGAERLRFSAGVRF